MTFSPSIAGAHALVQALDLLGVRDVVLAPGSRSAPLAYAFAAMAWAPAPGEPSGDGTGSSGGIRLHVRIDERDAGFLALGLARAGQARVARSADPSRLAPPVAVVTTSGTAVANLHPAVLEAHHAGVPLLVLTADRPHELRGTGANQTADQVGIFAGAVRLGVDVPAPTGRPGELQDLRAVVSRAVAAASGARTRVPGPVHLNLAYREPLAPTSAELAELSAPAAPQGEQPMPGGLVAVAPTVVGTVLDPDGVADVTATVVVAGDSAGAVARAVAESRGWPLLAEASSGSAGGPNLVAAHRLVLGSPALVGAVRQVAVFGRPTLSRPVQSLLARPDVRVVVVAPGAGQWPDAARGAAHVLADVPPAWLVAGQTDGGAGGQSGPDAWLRTWQSASAMAAEVVDRSVACGADGDDSADGVGGAVRPLDALQVAAMVARVSQPDDVLVIGSSNPVRDLDLVARWAEPPVVVANRGLAGIDGTLSTVLGVALGLQDPRATAERTGSGPTVRALVGDLTFLHDAGGLLVGPSEPTADVQIVVVNDDGGSIFATLEHGRTQDQALFERVFATPHGADLGSLCAGYGVQHDLVGSAEQLENMLANPPRGVSVVEVRVERASRHHSAQDLAAAVVEAL
ncbi:2-succinyl-5-enolpyruvyl-6-hydroxy-3-cyclohexene-1-carboxylic-acid synthase [Sanguibacter antarcticus]|uniref:2-succinyl-5-enolpyruvyl-6-hydroxy-3-cyclohexene-1-carboxylate synthase n=1 Tax=Sanguibacter antarcticus TaxID=372484 RepID=A0A2A9E647_9MICO|nr:2-succinyl-5-enolpyruvyl-6-hydroxy-3-cyclohexene-1-carboxylic-acid synthase [Sanguibacter antarcticus]PFG34126.1 2-succinyl-5-enolpyruvyl-6-hydroxy-3-cyclohexene-1-carboxylate synthase [Sanguibacter antarcticus]